MNKVNTVSTCYLPSLVISAVHRTVSKTDHSVSVECGRDKCPNRKCQVKAAASLGGRQSQVMKVLVGFYPRCTENFEAGWEVESSNLKWTLQPLCREWLSKGGGGSREHQEDAFAAIQTWSMGSLERLVTMELERTVWMGEDIWSYLELDLRGLMGG